jgi:alkyldihydroxyacetonephosphate synthase
VSPLRGAVAEVPESLVERLAAVCPVERAADAVAAASRDWWPLAMIWADDGTPVTPAAALVAPRSVVEVAAVAGACNDARVPLTVAAGRSGVCGASMPVHGGVVLDLTGLTGIVALDDASLVLDVRAGTFGTPLEAALRADHGVTLGHWPQSIDLSTVGGWLACRSAGQLSTRYGKIEDMVLGLDVVLADGRVVHTGGAPRAAVGPDLTQLFVGSEGTLGIITGARLRVHPVPEAEARAAFRFPSFADGLDACRRVLRRGATPAVLRLYDPVEADRHFGGTEGKGGGGAEGEGGGGAEGKGGGETEGGGDGTLLLVLDEGDSALVDGVMRVVHEECAEATLADPALLDTWLERRNDVSVLHHYIEQGAVVDTMEVAARWSILPAVYHGVLAALRATDDLVVASAHLSHGYRDGACLYFTFGAFPPKEGREDCYRRLWDAAMTATVERGAALSHHHGIGLNRGRYVRAALGAAHDVLAATKAALDPVGILNPGKLGLPSPWGEPAWP